MLPCRPIENAKLAVMIRSTYKNWKLPKMDEFYNINKMKSIPCWVLLVPTKIFEDEI